MSASDEATTCPECGEQVDARATYCRHCDSMIVDSEDDPRVVDDDAEGDPATVGESDDGGDPLLDPEGTVDDTLTLLTGLGAGVVVGLVGTFVLMVVTGSIWSLLVGFVVWLGSTVYLARQRTVQGAVSKASYATALVLLLISLIPLSPVADAEGGIEGRLAAFAGLLLFLAIPAAIAAGVGWFAGRYVPEAPGDDAAATDEAASSAGEQGSDGATGGE